MAETNILNPIDWQAQGMLFNPNPSYGFSRKMSNNRLLQRPRLGPFITRDVGNAGHVFPLSWVNTDLTTAQRVVKFYHDFKGGYFTFINPDWGSRHFVGRFTSEPEAVQTANGKWTIQGCLFEEVPTARMLAYPSDWINDGHTIYVVDDFFVNGGFRPTVALMQGGWLAISSSPLGLSSVDPSSYIWQSAGVAGTWAQMQYTGWGFKMTFPINVTNGFFGNLNVYLDAVMIVQDLDLSTGIATGGSANIALSISLKQGTTIPQYVTLTVTNVPLDIHLVKVAYAGPGSSGGTAIVFPPLTYMY